MQVLEGIRILDFTRAMAGPFCTMMLADLGAEVIKIEAPSTGDDSRGWGPPFVSGESAYFLSVNRNKKSLCLNLKKVKSLEIIHKLLKRCDVLVENYRPGTMEKLSLDFKRTRKINPKLIYCSISGFGQDGPYRELPGFDQVIQGMGGLMSITGEQGRPPVKVGIAVADIAGGMFAAYGILAALISRSKTGKGQMIDVSLLDCVISWLSYRASAYFVSGEIPKPLGSGHPVIVPYQAFKAKDSYLNIAVGNDQLWKKFCEVLGLEGMKENPKFKTNAKRVENREEVVGLISEVISTKSSEEWLKILKEAGIPCGPIYTVDQVFSDPQVLHRKMVRECIHPNAGLIRLVGNPVKLSENIEEEFSPPPLLGEHTRRILQDLGYSEEDIVQLKKEEVIYEYQKNK